VRWAALSPRHRHLDTATSPLDLPPSKRARFKISLAPTASGITPPRTEGRAPTCGIIGPAPQIAAPKLGHADDYRKLTSNITA